jgi:single-stranded DNA-binding protein
MQMLGSREGMGAGDAEEMPAATRPAAARPAAAKPAPNIAEMDDDIPF